MVKSGNGKGVRVNLIPELNVDGDIEDIDTYGGAFSVVYKINPKVSVEAGVGYQLSKSDIWEEDDDNLGIFINAPFKPYKGIIITPEIDWLDYMKRSDGSDDAKVLQIGAQLRIDI